MKEQTWKSAATFSQRTPARPARAGRHGLARFQPARAVLFILGLGAVACRARAEDDTPERTAREFIERMQRVHGDPQKSRAAYELLAANARTNLKQRADRATAATGRRVTPEEMLAPSRFYLGFQPHTWSTERGPDWALVKVEGDSGRGSSQIRCVREQGQWKVALELPDLPPVERRDVTR